MAQVKTLIRKIKLPLLVLLTPFAILFLYTHLSPKERRGAHVYEEYADKHIKNGMTITEVILLLGKPDDVSHENPLDFDSRYNSNMTVFEYYTGFLAPDQLRVVFHNGTVVSTMYSN